MTARDSKTCYCLSLLSILKFTLTLKNISAQNIEFTCTFNTKLNMVNRLSSMYQQYFIIWEEKSIPSLKLQCLNLQTLGMLYKMIYYNPFI